MCETHLYGNEHSMRLTESTIPSSFNYLRVDKHQHGYQGELWEAQCKGLGTLVLGISLWLHKIANKIDSSLSRSARYASLQSTSSGSLSSSCPCRQMIEIN